MKDKDKELGRICFTNNPWPAGHAIIDFQWTARLDPQTGIWFNFHLETEDYYQNASVVQHQDNSDWTSEVVWSNYHRCSLSSTQWGGHGFLVGTTDNPLCFANLAQQAFHIDQLPAAQKLPYEDRAFNIYLLGHDAVANHTIRIQPNQSDTSDASSAEIRWTGQIALAYINQHDFCQHFDVHVPRARFAGIRLPNGTSKEAGNQLLAPLVAAPEDFIFDNRGPFPVFRFADNALCRK